MYASACTCKSNTNYFKTIDMITSVTLKCNINGLKTIIAALFIMFVYLLFSVLIYNGHKLLSYIHVLHISTKWNVKTFYEACSEPREILRSRQLENIIWN